MKISSPYANVEGIGFSIPSNTVVEVINVLMRDSFASRPSFGITMEPIPEEIAEFYDIPQGLYISVVQEASDAYAKKIRPGDILTAIDGTAVSSTEEVLQIRNSHKIGDSLKLTLFRDGRFLVVDVIIYDAGVVQ